MVSVRASEVDPVHSLPPDEHIEVLPDIVA